MLKEKLNKIKNLKFVSVIILVVIIVLQMLNITNIIVDRKKGYHSDEVFSYGLSNSFYEPFIYVDYIWQKDYKNVNEWISGDALREYITVQPDETFRYDSVWYNQSKDRHPPLYYAVLHTICSFFPNTFSPVFGYIINYICFIVTQIFLYKLSKNMLKSKYLALLVCLLWGFCAGAIDITIFIRMYCMLVMWTVIFMYLHSKLLVNQYKPTKKMYLSLVIVTALGALTHHSFLIIAFFTAVFFCICYLVKKQYKSFWKYGFSVLGGTVLSILIFPYTVSQLLQESGDTSFPIFIKQLDLLCNYILRDIMSIMGSEPLVLLYTVPVFILIAMIFSLPILYLFRNNPSVKKFLCGLKKLPQKIKCLRFGTIIKGFKKDVKKINPLFYLFFICVAVICIFTAYRINFMDMQYVNRYMFIVYPLVALLFVYFAYFIFTRFKFRKIVLTIIFSAVVLHSLAGRGITYLFDNERTINSLSELTADSECIFVDAQYYQTWLISVLPFEIYDADKVFMTYITEDKDIEKKMASLKTDKKVYLFLNEFSKQNVNGNDIILCNEKDTNKTSEINLQEYYAVFKNMPYSTMFKYIGKYTIFHRTYTIYQIA